MYKNTKNMRECNHTNMLVYLQNRYIHFISTKYIVWNQEQCITNTAHVETYGKLMEQYRQINDKKRKH